MPPSKRQMLSYRGFFFFFKGKGAYFTVCSVERAFSVRSRGHCQCTAFCGCRQRPQTTRVCYFTLCGSAAYPASLGRNQAISRPELPSGGSRGEFDSLPFPAARGTFLGSLLSSSIFEASFSHRIWPPLLPLSSSLKDPWDYSGPIWTIQDNVPILRSAA